MSFVKLFGISCNVLVAALFLAGCVSIATSGSSYIQPQLPSIPAGKALVCLYMTVGASKINVKHNGQHIGDVGPFKYFYYVADPGNLDFTFYDSFTKKKKHLTINAEPGKTYYLRSSMDTSSFFVSFKVEWVRDETGYDEVAHCRLMQ